MLCVVGVVQLCIDLGLNTDCCCHPLPSHQMCTWLLNQQLEEYLLSIINQLDVKNFINFISGTQFAHHLAHGCPTIVINSDFMNFILTLPEQRIAELCGHLLKWTLVVNSYLVDIAQHFYQALLNYYLLFMLGKVFINYITQGGGIDKF